MYRDDGIIAFRGKWMKKRCNQWLQTFQHKVNKLCGSQYLVFEMVVWGADKEDGSATPKVKVHAADSFPYLDIKLYYRDQHLNFGLHRKEHQELRYLNAGSTHTDACKKAISVGVFDRCCRLTSHIPDPEAPVNTLFPNEAWALLQGSRQDVRNALTSDLQQDCN